VNWHAELVLEAIVLALLNWRKYGLKWFESLIGADLVCQTFQLIFERASLHGMAILVWKIGVVIIVPLRAMSFVEASRKHSANLFRKHIFILSWWTALLMMCKSAAWARYFPWNNHVLLLVDAGAFVAWSAIFLID
jgi:hypothetical protein